MRLLNTETGLLEFFDEPRRTPQYAILSHVWGKKADTNFIPELEFKDIPTVSPSCDTKNSLNWLKRNPKVWDACRIAREHGYKYIWIDTCCINKSDNAELSEALNSMFVWYRSAQVCYVILDDVEPSNDPPTEDKLQDSKWFTRGWTLQELIAPRNVLLFYKNWSLIGRKDELADVLHRITNINPAVLKHETQLSQVSVAERMSWASKRDTTKVEDIAYCLLGIFNVHITPIYGEGRYAFTRLQEAILGRIPDQSIFAWGRLDHNGLSLEPPEEPEEGISVMGSPGSFLLAPSPRDFSDSRGIARIPPEDLATELGITDLFYPDFTITAYGIRAILPLVPCFDRAGRPFNVALLACKAPGDKIVGLVLRSSRPPPRDAEMIVGAAPHVGKRAVDATRPYRSSEVEILSLYFRLAAFPIQALREVVTKISTSDVYIRHHLLSSLHAPNPDDLHVEQRLCEARIPEDRLKISLQPWCEGTLRLQGYEVKAQGRLVFLLRSSLPEGGRDVMTIRFGRCKCPEGVDHGWLRLNVVLSGGLGVCHSTLQTGVQDVDTDLPSCSKTHIRSWTIEDGCAWTTFINPHPAIPSFRMTISLADPYSGLYSLPTPERTYLLDLSIANFDTWENEEQDCLYDRSQSTSPQFMLDLDHVVGEPDHEDYDDQPLAFFPSPPVTNDALRQQTGIGRRQSRALPTVTQLPPKSRSSARDKRSPSALPPLPELDTASGKSRHVMNSSLRRTSRSHTLSPHAPSSQKTTRDSTGNTNRRPSTSQRHSTRGFENTKEDWQHYIPRQSPPPRPTSAPQAALNYDLANDTTIPEKMDAVDGNSWHQTVKLLVLQCCVPACVTLLVMWFGGRSPSTFVPSTPT